MTRLILCADDYAIAPGVSRAILRLIEARRISATSCLVVSPFWPEHGQWLRGHADAADIGLHLALTDMMPLGPMPLTCPTGRFPSVGVLIGHALRLQIDRAEIAAEINRQVSRFQSVLGRPPAFIDGHQHVQQLPVIRDIVVDLWRDKIIPATTWLRVGKEPLSAVLGRRTSIAKSLIISAFGSGLRRLADSAGIPVNDRFSGIYDFSDRVPYPVLFERFVSGRGTRALVMCHPGEIDAELLEVDPVTTSRARELAFLESAAFIQLLDRRGLALSRFFS